MIFSRGRTKMNICSLTDIDIDQCLEIYNYYILNTAYTLEEKELTHDEFYSRCHLITDKYPFIVVKNDEGKVLGYAYLDVFNSRSAYRKTADLSIYVNKDHLHEHLGKNLLEEIEKLAKIYGITNIISLITSENPNSAKFHLRNGFYLEATLKNVAIKFNKDISVFYYRKTL